MTQAKRFAPPLHAEKGAKGTRAKVMVGQWDTVGELPAILVTIRMSYRHVHNFVRCCGSRGIAIRACDKAEKYAAIPTTAAEIWALVEAHGSATFEACGDLESLEYLAEHPSVATWSYVDRTACAVGMGRGQGQCKK